MAVKSIRIYVTEEQYATLIKKAKKANVSMSEFIRQILITGGAIAHEEIEHGGYRPRRRKVKKKI